MLSLINYKNNFLDINRGIVGEDPLLSIKFDFTESYFFQNPSIGHFVVYSFSQKFSFVDNTATAPNAGDSLYQLSPYD
jgi:hypothetical protein